MAAHASAAQRKRDRIPSGFGTGHSLAYRGVLPSQLAIFHDVENPAAKSAGDVRRILQQSLPAGTPSTGPPQDESSTPRAPGHEDNYHQLMDDFSIDEPPATRQRILPTASAFPIPQCSGTASIYPSPFAPGSTWSPSSEGGPFGNFPPGLWPPSLPQATPRPMLPPMLPPMASTPADPMAAHMQQQYNIYFTSCFEGQPNGPTYDNGTALIFSDWEWYFTRQFDGNSHSTVQGDLADPRLQQSEGIPWGIR